LKLRPTAALGGRFAGIVDLATSLRLEEVFYEIPIFLPLGKLVIPFFTVANDLLYSSSLTTPGSKLFLCFRRSVGVAPGVSGPIYPGINPFSGFGKLPTKLSVVLFIREG